MAIRQPKLVHDRDVQDGGRGEREARAAESRSGSTPRPIFLPPAAAPTPPAPLGEDAQASPSVPSNFRARPGGRRARAARAGTGAETRDARGGGGAADRVQAQEGGGREDPHRFEAPIPPLRVRAGVRARGGASGPPASPPRPIPPLHPRGGHPPCPFLRPFCDLLRPALLRPTLASLPPSLGGRWRSQQQHRRSRGRELPGRQRRLGTGWRRGGPRAPRGRAALARGRRRGASASRGGHWHLCSSFFSCVLASGGPDRAAPVPPVVVRGAGGVAAARSPPVQSLSHSPSRALARAPGEGATAGGGESRDHSGHVSGR